MANRIAGIVVEIGGDTSKLTQALAGVDKSIRGTQSALKDIDKLLKLDPGNAELLAQKQKNLAQAITETKDRLKTLKDASEQAAKTAGNYDAWKEKYDPIQAEIKETSDELKKLREQSEKASKELSEGKISQEQYDGLQKEIKETEERLKDLKTRAKEVTEQFGNPMPPEQFDAMQREIIETEQKLESLEKEYKDFGSVAKQELEQVAQKIEGAGEKIEGVGGKISGFGGTITKSVTVPIVGAATASVAAWKEVDEAMDTITIKTGATGDALADMQDRAKDIAKTIPVSFQTAADAVGEVNTRFGLTGDALQELSTQVAQFAELNGTDVTTSVDSVQSAMAAWNMENSRAGDMLNILNKVGQDTGASVLSMADALVTNAASLQEMNLGVEDAAVLLGNLDKNGIDTTAAMQGLKKAYAESIETGVPMSEMLIDLEHRLRDNSTQAGAAQEAMELFGTKAGPQLIAALESGRLSFEDLDVEMGIFSDNVSNTFAETQDPLDTFTTLLNSIKDLGAELVDTAGPMIEQALGAIKDVVQQVSDAWNGLSEEQQQAILKIVGIAAVVGPVIAVVGKLTGAIGGVVQGIGSFIGSLGMIASPAGLAVAAIAGIVAIGVALYQNWDDIKAWASEKWNAIKDSVSNAVNTAKEKISQAWETVKTNTSEAWENVKAKISGVWDSVKSKVSEAAENVKSKVSAAWESVKSKTSEAWENVKGSVSAKWESIRSTVQSKAEDVKSKVSSAWDSVKSKTSSVWESAKSVVSEKVGGMADAIRDKLNSAKSTVSSIFDSIKSSISSKLESAKSVVSSAIEKIKGFFNFSWSLPPIKLPHFSITGKFSLNPPQIPHFSVQWYKKAMDNAAVLDSATIFGVAGGNLLGGGEAGREVVSGESHLVQLIADAVKSNSVGQIVLPIYINGVFTRKEIIDIAQQGISRKMLNINAAKGRATT